MTRRRGILLLAGAIAQGASAAALIQADRFHLAPTSTLAGVVFLQAATSAELAGTCADDLFALAQDAVGLTGAFANDVWAAANRVELSGAVADHARLAARRATVRGAVSNGLWLAANNARLETNSFVAGGAVIFGEEVWALGRVNGPLRIRANKITLGGAVAGDARLEGADIVLLPGLRVEGELTYVAERLLTPDGSVTITAGLRRELPPVAPPRARTWWPVYLGLYLGALAAGWVTSLAFPRLTDGAVASLRKSFWSSLLFGSLALGLIPLLAPMLWVSLIGLPLGLLLLLVWLGAVYTGQFVVALAWVHRWRPDWVARPGAGRRFRALALGLAPLYGLPLWSAVWWPPMLLVVVWLGAGAWLRALLGRERMRS